MNSMVGRKVSAAAGLSLILTFIKQEAERRRRKSKKRGGRGKKKAESESAWHRNADVTLSRKDPARVSSCQRKLNGQISLIFPSLLFSFIALIRTGGRHPSPPPPPSKRLQHAIKPVRSFNGGRED
jgi:hypothetical protein